MNSTMYINSYAISLGISGFFLNRDEKTCPEPYWGVCPGLSSLLALFLSDPSNVPLFSVESVPLRFRRFLDDPSTAVSFSLGDIHLRFRRFLSLSGFCQEEEEKRYIITNSLLNLSSKYRTYVRV